VRGIYLLRASPRTIIGGVPPIPAYGASDVGLEHVGHVPGALPRLVPGLAAGLAKSRKCAQSTVDLSQLLGASRNKVSVLPVQKVYMLL
jgi:hypothetical protein